MRFLLCSSWALRMRLLSNAIFSSLVISESWSFSGMSAKSSNLSLKVDFEDLPFSMIPLRWGEGIVNFEGGGLFSFKSCLEFGEMLSLLRDWIVSESCVLGVGEWIRFTLCCWELFIVLRTNLATGDRKLSRLLFIFKFSLVLKGEFDLTLAGFGSSLTVFEVSEFWLLVRSKSTCVEIDFGDCCGLHWVSQLTSWGLVFVLVDTNCALKTVVKVWSVV